MTNKAERHSRHKFGAPQKNGYTSRSILFKTTLCCSLIFAQPPVQATDAILLGGGNHVHDSHERFEDSVRWIRSVLSEQDVASTTYFNDGDNTAPDISYTEDDPSNELSRAASIVFGSTQWQTLRYRDHRLKDVEASTSIATLESAINAKLADSTVSELLLVHSGRGGRPGDSEDTASITLWNDDRLTVKQLHQWTQRSNTPVRFVLSQSHSGGFHRLAYQDAEHGLELTNQTHCGFTATSAYRSAETSLSSLNDTDYRDYASYFFSAIAGYEHDGEIINRFSDLNEDGQTSLREAHLFSLSEGKSIDLPLSTSEDYLLRWQPWYLRWQPAQKTLPNNEYTRIFREIASQMNIPLVGNVAREIRLRRQGLNQELKQLEQLHRGQSTAIALLQATLQLEAYARWPQLKAPYTGGFETLILSGQMTAINAFFENRQPEYSELVELTTKASNTQVAKTQLRRELAAFNKLIQLRHLALLRGQLYENGSAAQIRDYRSLVNCEEAPLHPMIDGTKFSAELRR